MGRLRVPAPSFTTDTVEPEGATATRYIRVTSAVSSGTTLNATGRAAADVWACMLVRCRSWLLSISGTVSGSLAGGGSWSGGYSGTVPLVASGIAPVTGYTDHPEVATAMQEFFTAADGVASELGSWNATGGGGTDSGNWEATGGASFLRSGSSLGITWNGPLCVAGTLLIPFQLNLNMLNVSTEDAPSESWDSIFAHRVSTLALGGYVECGTLEITVPNWRDGGTTTLEMPLFHSNPLAEGMTASVSATLTPASGSYFAYGSAADNSNPRWNADGTANGTPGT